MQKRLPVVFLLMAVGECMKDGERGQAAERSRQCLLQYGAPAARLALPDERADRWASVLTSCRIFAVPVAGDRPEQLDRFGIQGRRLPSTTGAHVLLWGELRRNRLEVRFISGASTPSCNPRRQIGRCRRRPEMWRK